MIARILVVWLACLATGIACADQHEQEIKNIRAKLAKTIPDHSPDLIEPSPIPGIYQVSFGTQIVYVSADGRYAMQGTVFDLEDERKNLTAAAESRARLQFQEEIGNTPGIVFSPKKVRHSITVFTDIDCPYCVKLHNEMAELNSYGIEVKYLMFPRAGLQSASFRKAVSVWCSEDRNDAITKAKAGETIPAKDCDSPIETHYLLGQKVGVSGTPAILLEDGTLLPGYQPAKQLVDLLDSMTDS